MEKIEALLSEFADAQRSGVFLNTARPRLESMVEPKGPSVFLSRSRRFVAVAAVFLLAASVWTMMFRVNLSDIRKQAQWARQASDLELRSTLAMCVAGPSQMARGDCGRVDFDKDGDVDLGDFSAYQRLAAVTQ